MIRWVTLGSVLCFLMAASPADLFAQFNPYGNRSNPYGPECRSARAPCLSRAGRGHRRPQWHATSWKRMAMRRSPPSSPAPGRWR